ncbi:hypothetical protein BJ875DRAFT_437643 [Amylocarpus encephaloides]|uniref:Mucin n=1 Tax=Amylocarpus encephaloides TaxID=45428 RepID=A0A9P7YR42_9HELO|nr:hypothetical protein BJ875DRAFT_437643 [Amylocarpus encephaloides]
MAPSRSLPFKSKPIPNAGTTLEVPSRRPFHPPISSSTRSTIVDQKNISTTRSLSATSSASDWPSASLPPTTLQAHTLGRPSSSLSLPPTARSRKNMKDFTGFDTTEDEFERLPLAVRRKYFSTLERLRLAERANSQALDELPIQPPPRPSPSHRRDVSITELRQQPLSPRRPRKGSSSNNEASWFLNLPPKIKRKNFTTEERIMLDGRLQDKVILDASDEAVYKAGRKGSRNAPAVDPFSDSPVPTTPMTSPSSQERNEPMSAAIYESFRWMDEESNLDLRLVLDDYHANLDGVVIPTPASNRRPSFRRQLSISKIPFGRPSLSSLQPRSPKAESLSNMNARQRSRTLSLIAPKHVVHDSVASIDPNATHYQDPEARLKLRVYLASPQKFDEAIEFGFPSMDGVTAADDKENKSPSRFSKENSGNKQSFATEGGRSFLDDSVSLFADDVSMMEPESPVTPMAIDLGFESRPSISALGGKSTKTSGDYSHLGITKPLLVKQLDNYHQANAGSREMTLRMTLTRPDLRADESTIYGWQTPKSPMREASAVFEDMDEKLEMKGPLGGVDGWGPAEKENHGLKRFWQRVKSSQRKV